MNLGDCLAIKGWCSCVTIFIKSIQCPTFGVQTLESDKYEYNACSVKTQSFLASTRSSIDNFRNKPNTQHSDNFCTIE